MSNQNNIEFSTKRFVKFFNNLNNNSNIIITKLNNRIEVINNYEYVCRINKLFYNYGSEYDKYKIYTQVMNELIKLSKFKKKNRIGIHKINIELTKNLENRNIIRITFLYAFGVKSAYKNN